MATDYYAESRRLADDLRAEGLGDCADALLDAIESGSTGTEILMAIKWNLDRLIAAGEGSRDLMLRASGLRTELVKALSA
jgi:hypothetical protein